MRPALRLSLLLLGACGAPPPTTLSVQSAVATQDADGQVTVSAVAVSDQGWRTTPTGTVLKGTTAIATLSVTDYGDGKTVKLGAHFDPSLAFDASTTAPVNGQVSVTLTVSVEHSGLKASGSSKAQLGCQTGLAICAGKCVDLTASRTDCGSCGNTCDLQLGTVYQGRCQASRCQWPSVTIRSAPASCESVCASTSFKSKPLQCVAKCAYTATFDSAYADQKPGQQAGVVRYLTDIKNLPTCDFVATAHDHTYGSFQFEGCCCEATP